MNIKDENDFSRRAGRVIAGVSARAGGHGQRAGQRRAGRARTPTPIWTPRMTALFGDPVIAKGKGFEIKQSDLDEVMTGIKAGRRHAQPDHSPGPDESD